MEEGIGGISSVPTPVIYGVPQGSVLGPILYILYNTPMHDISVASGIMDHYFADDAQGYKSFRPSPRLFVLFTGFLFINELSLR